MPDLAREVFFNGRIIAADEARLSIEDRAARCGLGFFETFRTSGGRPHHWSYNRDRLRRGCATTGIKLPSAFLASDEARLRATVAKLLDSTALNDAVFRYTVFAGADETPSEALVARALPSPAPPAGIALRALKLARDNGEFLPRPKSLNYTNALLGAEELAHRATAPSDEGLFLSREGGFVVETPRQNLAWFANGELRFPDPAIGVVAGTCLQWLLETSGCVIAPRRAPLQELLAAEAIFVCNAVRGITPVRRIWDLVDGAVLRELDSAGDPRVIALMKKWDGSLEATFSGR